MKKQPRQIIFVVLFLFILIVYAYLSQSPVTSWGHDANYRNVTVRTTVNVTQAYPEILNITCYSNSDVTLNAGSTKNINCTVEIRDYNGGGDINNTNMTFYYYLNASSDPEDNNTHYTNYTCVNGTVSGYYVNWTCAVDIWYYANNGSWRANITVSDKYNLTRRSYRNVTISPLYALNVTTPIDFGSMAVGDTSGATQANITNLGNRPINISLYGYGGENETTGAGLAMICDIRNITRENEKYAINITDYEFMTSITGSAVTIPDLVVNKQTLAGTQVINSTYWRLHVNESTNPFGICNGTVVFNAVAP
jgi:hypothetical protein